MKQSYIIQLLLILILTFGAFLRFYKLDWGQGFFSHPDEYHLVIAISKLAFPSQMNPHFFAYGTVPIYLIYFTNTLYHSVISFFTTNSELITPNFFLIGRFYSAFFSTLTILIIYLIAKKFMSKGWALCAAMISALTPGLIQQAHFATPESTLIFFLLTSLYFLISFIHKPKFFLLILFSIFFGLALGTKVSTAVFGLVLLLGITMINYHSPKELLKSLLLFLIVTVVTLVVTSPFIFLDFSSFYSNIKYEGSLATGSQLVFYTRQFIDTVPIIFQLEKIYPYVLGPGLLILGIAGLGLAFLSLIRKFRAPVFLLLIAFLSLFLPNALLFTKWTRFIAPTFPFFAILAAFLLFKFSQQKIISYLIIILTGTFFILHLLWALAFFSIYLRDDVRVAASNWLNVNLAPNSSILVEGGNTIDIPLQGTFPRTSLDFYELDNSPAIQQELSSSLNTTDYFIIQSRRVFVNHLRLPDLYPKTADFYRQLFNGDLGFTEIKKFTSYPTLTLGNLTYEIPDEMAEETFSVFDHPVIRVYQKTKD